MKKILSIVLTLAMVLGCASTIFAGTSSSELNYVVIGDSYSSGYRFEWLEPAGAKKYFEVFAEYLGTKTGKTVNVYDKLCYEGFRANDVLALLTESTKATGTSKPIGDAITDYWYHGRYSEIDANIAAVENANIVSIKLGYNSIISYLKLALMKDLGLEDTEDNVKLDDKFEDLFTVEQKKVLNTIKKDLYSILEEELDQETLDELNTSIAGILQYKFGKFYTVDDYLNFAAYSLCGAMVYYDQLLARIYELNSDVDVYVIQLDNPFDAYQLTYTNEDGEEYEIQIGKMVGALYDLFNVYYSIFSDYSTKTYFVNNETSPEMFGDKVVKDDTFAKKFTNVFYEKNGVDESVRATYVDNTYKNVQKYLAVKDYNLNQIIDGVKAKGTDGLVAMLNASTVSNLLANYSENALDQFFMMMNLMLLCMDGAGCHPSADGHATMAASFVKSYEKRTALEEAVVYHYIIKNIPDGTADFLYAKTLSEVRNIISKYQNQYYVVRRFISTITTSASTAESVATTIANIPATIEDIKDTVTSNIATAVKNSINSMIKNIIKKFLK